MFWVFFCVSKEKKYWDDEDALIFISKSLFFEHLETFSSWPFFGLTQCSAWKSVLFSISEIGELGKVKACEAAFDGRCCLGRAPDGLDLIALCPSGKTEFAASVTVEPAVSVIQTLSSKPSFVQLLSYISECMCDSLEQTSTHVMHLSFCAKVGEAP